MLKISEPLTVCVVAGTGGSSALVDLYTRRVPNELTMGVAGAGDVKLFAALGAWLGPSHIVTAFFYTALAGGLLAVIVALRRRRLSTTLQRTAELVASGGGNAALIEHKAENNRFAYAPAIAAGTLAAALGL